MDAMARLCPTAVWLEAGRVRAIGPTDRLVNEYVRLTAADVPQVVYEADTSAPGPDRRHLVA